MSQSWVHSTSKDHKASAARGVIVQVSPSEVPVGSGSGFPINMVADGYDYLLEAPGDLTGCILVHNDNVKQIAATLGANVAPLVSYDLITQHMVVFPGMSVQSAVNAATEGATIEVESGTFDQTPVQISTTVTLLGGQRGERQACPRPTAQANPSFRDWSSLGDTPSSTASN